MSNRKRTRWTEAQITAANAEQLLAGLYEDATASATRQVVTEHLLADAEAAGCDLEPGMVAAVEQAAMELGDEYWAETHRRLMAAART
jgi:hypothetical protein